MLSEQKRLVVIPSLHVRAKSFLSNIKNIQYYQIVIVLDGSIIKALFNAGRYKC